MILIECDTYAVGGVPERETRQQGHKNSPWSAKAGIWTAASVPSQWGAGDGTSRFVTPHPETPGSRYLDRFTLVATTRECADHPRRHRPWRARLASPRPSARATPRVLRRALRDACRRVRCDDPWERTWRYPARAWRTGSATCRPSRGKPRGRLTWTQHQGPCTSFSPAKRADPPSSPPTSSRTGTTSRSKGPSSRSSSSSTSSRARAGRSCVRRCAASPMGP
jgi:hypothetical protein